MCNYISHRSEQEPLVRMSATRPRQPFRVFSIVHCLEITLDPKRDRHEPLPNAKS
jgi:hypothetical protein